MDELLLRPAAGLVVRDDRERILLIRRRGEETWGLPGGGLLPGETWAAAAVRECQEETGWLARIDELLGIYSDPDTQVHRYPSGALRHFVGVVFLATATEKTGTPDGEAAELRWVKRAKMPTPLFAPDVPVLQDAFGPVESRPIIG